MLIQTNVGFLKIVFSHSTIKHNSNTQEPDIFANFSQAKPVCFLIENYSIKCVYCHWNRLSEVERLARTVSEVQLKNSVA